MNENKKILIVDIGSHELEELSVLLKPHTGQYFLYIKWTIFTVLRAIKRMSVAELKKFKGQMQVLKYYFFSKRNYGLQVVSVEPNVGAAHKYVKKLAKKYPVHYMPIAVLGHDTEKDAELKTLFFYDQSISSSIYVKNKPMNNEKASLCVGLRFEVLWDGLIEQGIIEKDTPFLLRMNCEGAELGVIEACKAKGLKPMCIIGSLGDMDKIHGQEVGDKTRAALEEMDLPYYYFKGSDPATWHEMIGIWDKYTLKFRKDK